MVPVEEGVHIDTKPAPVVEKDQRRKRQADGEVEQTPVVDPVPVPALEVKPVDDVKRQSEQEVAADKPDNVDAVEPVAGKPVVIPAPVKETGRQNNQSPFLHRPLVKKPSRPVSKPEVPEQNQDSEVQERQSEADFNFGEPTFQLGQLQPEEEDAQQPVQPLSGTDAAFHKGHDFNGQSLLERRRRMEDRRERQEVKQVGQGEQQLGQVNKDVEEEDNKKKRQVPHRVGQLEDGQIEQEQLQEGQGEGEQENKRKRKVPNRTAHPDEAEGQQDAQQEQEDGQHQQQQQQQLHVEDN